ncbi:MAG: hypothetical protein HS115_14840 [Spirochaetales bacterium]|nr:hypothetical protein [Spirochaetales bacterium]
MRGALPGERVTVQPVKETKDHIFVTTARVLEASPDRTAVDCAIFPGCGGCAFRHTSYAYELQTKLALLQEWKFIAPLCEKAILYAARPDRYRSRARLQIRGGLAGFFAYRQNAFLALPSEGCRQLPFSASSLQSLARKKQDGELLLRWHNQKTIIDRSDHFSQANYLLFPTWLDTIRRLIGNPSRAIELFCGSGIIGRSVLPASLHYTGYDLSPAAIREAKKHSQWKYMVHDLYSRPVELKSDLILANPPRAGLKKMLSGAIDRSDAHQLIYSSCNPATLNRDLGYLKQWEPVSLFVFDFFPRTHHLELLVCLQRKR